MKRNHNRVKDNVVLPIGTKQQVVRHNVDFFRKPKSPKLGIEASFPKTTNQPSWSAGVPSEVRIIITDLGGVNQGFDFVKHKDKIIKHIIQPYIDKIDIQVEPKGGRKASVTINNIPYSDGDTHSLTARQVTEISHLTNKANKGKLSDNNASILTNGIMKGKFVTEYQEYQALQGIAMLTKTGQKEINTTDYIKNIHAAFQKSKNQKDDLDKINTVKEAIESNSKGKWGRGKHQAKLNKEKENYIQSIDNISTQFDKLLEHEYFTGTYILEHKSKHPYGWQAYEDYTNDIIAKKEKINEKLMKLKDQERPILGSFGTTTSPITGTEQSPFIREIVDIDEKIDTLSTNLQPHGDFRDINHTIDLTHDFTFVNYNNKINNLRNKFINLINALLRYNDLSEQFISNTKYAHNRSQYSMGTPKISETTGHIKTLDLAMTQLLTEDTKNGLKQANRWKKAVSQKGKRPYNRIIWDENSNTYQVQIINNDETVKAKYNPKYDLSNRKDMTPLLVSQVLNEDSIKTFNYNNIITKGNLEKLGIPLQLSESDIKSIKNLKDKLDNSGFNGMQLINDHINGIADLEVNDPQQKEIMDLLDRIKISYNSELEIIISKNERMITNDFRTEDNPFDFYPWDHLSDGTTPGVRKMLNHFDYRKTITPTHSTLDLIRYGQTIGLFTVIESDENGFPTKLYVKDVSEIPQDEDGNITSPTIVESKMVDITNTKDRKQIYNYLQQALGMIPNEQFEQETLDQIQQEAVMVMVDEWTPREVILYSNFFNFPMSNSQTDRIKREKFINNLEDSLFENILQEEIGLKKQLKIYLQQNPSINKGIGDIKEYTSAIKHLLTIINVDAGILNDYQDLTKSIKNNDTENSQQIVRKLTERIDKSELDINAYNINQTKEILEAEGLFTLLLMDLRKSDTGTAMGIHTIKSIWDNMLNIEISDDLRKQKDLGKFNDSIGKLVEEAVKKQITEKKSGKKYIFSEDGKQLKQKAIPDDDMASITDFIDKYSKRTSTNTADLEEKIIELVKIGYIANIEHPIVKFNTKDSNTREGFQMAFLRRLFAELLIRNSVVADPAGGEKDQIGYNLIDEVNMQENFKIALKDIELLPRVELADLNILKVSSEALSAADVDLSSTDLNIPKGILNDKEIAELLKNAPAPKVKKRIESKIIDKSIPTKEEMAAALSTLKDTKPVIRESTGNKQKDDVVKTLDYISKVSTRTSQDLDKVYGDDPLTQYEQHFMNEFLRRSAELQATVNKMSSLLLIEDKSTVDEEMFNREYVRSKKLIQEQIIEINQIVPQTQVTAGDFIKSGLKTDKEVLTAEELKRKKATKSNVERYNKRYPNIEIENFFSILTTLEEENDELDKVAREAITTTGISPKTRPMKAKPKAKPPFQPEDTADTDLSALKKLAKKPPKK